jgi:hypothetical protein
MSKLIDRATWMRKCECGREVIPTRIDEADGVYWYIKCPCGRGTGNFTVWNEMLMAWNYFWLEKIVRNLTDRLLDIRRSVDDASRLTVPSGYLLFAESIELQERFLIDKEKREKFLEKHPEYLHRTCHCDVDGDCTWELCPQNIDGEPGKSDRSCPLRTVDEEE